MTDGRPERGCRTTAGRARPRRSGGVGGRASPGRSAARSVARAGDAALPSLWELDRPATLVVGGYGGIGGLTSGANLLERLNKEIKRRTDVVGVSPIPRPCCGWPARCSSKPTTNGRPASAATCPKGP